jgi:hypothetical protein
MCGHTPRGRELTTFDQAFIGLRSFGVFTMRWCNSGDKSVFSPDACAMVAIYVVISI